MANIELWLSILSVCISLATPVVVFIARNFLLAWISKGVQHSFDVKLETLRTELRKNEERLKIDLRDREAEITALRNSVLSGSMSRQSLLDKRRFDAVEKVWTTVNDLSQLKPLSGLMATMNYKEIAKDAGHPNMQRFLSLIGNVAPHVKYLKKNAARDEQPFLLELAWAYFVAYKTILYLSFARFSALQSAVPERYFTSEATKKILKATLPHQSDFIEQHEPEAYHYLLDEIEGYLLIELKRVLEGADADLASAGRAKAIMDAVKSVDEDRAKDAVAAAKGE